MKKNPFVTALNTTFTENGALALASSGTACVDLFALAGAMRTQTEDKIKALFASAYAEEPLTALKIAFYLRDVRGGQGERRAFRVIADWLAEKATPSLLNNLENIPEFGRWDDVVRLVDSTTPEVVHTALMLIRAQWEDDVKTLTFRRMTTGVEVRPSLLAKWLPSGNASSKETRARARKIAKFLKISDAKYRKTLSALRAKLNVVERQMCAGDWSEIKYAAVPSRAALLYRKAFPRHDADGYAAFLASVEKGEAKINAGVLYPHEIAGRALRGENNATLEALWKALPEYLPENTKAIAVCDVSGSMSGTPLEVSVGLGMYLAERNVGPFHNAFITFSTVPKLEVLQGASLYEKATNLSRASWNMSTDFDAVFRLILDRAKFARLEQADMPQVIYCISDMQFNSASRGNMTNFESIREDYAKAGYEMPTLVFWNVRAANTQTPVSAHENGTVLVSGFSASTFKTVVTRKNVTPYEAMLAVIDQPRYACVKG